MIKYLAKLSNEINQHRSCGKVEVEDLLLIDLASTDFGERFRSIFLEESDDAYVMKPIEEIDEGVLTDFIDDYAGYFCDA